MKKIISLYQRNYETDRLVRDEVVPGAEWVIAGEGKPTQKHDGTACMVRNGKLYKRYEVKPGRLPPANFEPANELDENTGKQQGWIPVGDGPEDKWHREAFLGGLDWAGNPLIEGQTYELCGPKVQGNSEKLEIHILILHGSIELKDVPRDFEGIKAYLSTHNVEGIVWHHADARMVKIKTRDFGLKRTANEEVSGGGLPPSA